MRRVFEVDVLECPRCHGAMRICAQIHPAETTNAILECLRLPARAPPVTPPDAAEHAVTNAIPWIDDFDPPHPTDEF